MNEHKKEKKDKGHEHGEDEDKKEAGKEKTEAASNDTALDTGKCGSCYGAETKMKKCCNT